MICKCLHIGRGLFDSKTTSREKNYFHPIQPKLMTMSSFLMNSSPYVEPKFPPNEEYSHNNYIPSTQAEEFYRRTAQNYGYGASGAPEPRRYSQESFPGNPAYGCPTSNGLSLGAGEAINAINTQGHRITQASPHQRDNDGVSPVHPGNCQPSNTSPPSNMAQCNQPQSMNHSSHPANLSNSVNNNANNNALNNNNSSPNSNATPPVIYPWMKRVHIGSSSKYCCCLCLLK